MGYVIDWTCNQSFPPIRLTDETEGEALAEVVATLIRHHLAIAESHLNAIRGIMQDG